MTDAVNHKMCEIALNYSEGKSFEEFSQAFHSALTGVDFVPLGGVHDGGADGFSEAMYVSGARASFFMQASITPGYEKKIRDTVKRLREFGRTPSQVIFYFSKEVQNSDKVDENLSVDLDVVIRIRSAKYIVSHINDNAGTISAFNSYLRPLINFLSERPILPSHAVLPLNERTLCAYLSHESERRLGQAPLLSSVTDGLILWSLEGTDPDKGKFLTRDEVLAKIIEAVPSSKVFIAGVIDDRLESMSKRSAASERQISWYRKEGYYCLNYEQRKYVEQQNIDEISLYIHVRQQFIELISNSVVLKLRSIPMQFARYATQHWSRFIISKGWQLAFSLWRAKKMCSGRFMFQILLMNEYLL